MLHEEHTEIDRSISNVPRKRKKVQPDYSPVCLIKILSCQNIEHLVLLYVIKQVHLSKILLSFGLIV